MYKLENIKDIHIEITSKCQARCPMCPRRINGGLLNPLINIDEINLDTFKSWFPQSFIKQLNSLFMCGNLGDPIIARDCLEILQYIRQVNPTIHLSLHTNGSARTVTWWEDLAVVDVRVVFGIDGLSDTHALYRVGTDFHQILRNATAFILAGGSAEWHMLVFEHNEHEIDVCKNLSEELGFKSFVAKHTTRFKEGKFNVLDDVGKTTHILYPTEKSKDMMSKVTGYITDINPEIKCKAQKSQNLYISACGKVSPCCWLDFDWILPNQDSRIDYMDKIGVLPDLNINSLVEIFDSGYFNKIAETWSNNPLMECSKQCGNFDKLGAQFER
jgi:MoaA/NifB/PqqE/SkfB family radical SAM enzyme